MENEMLYHHGIKGMRWGVRRYQNSDGTLTAAGRKRYSDTDRGQALKSEYKQAKTALNKANDVYSKASNKVSYLPTEKNRREYANASKAFEAAKLNYKKTKLEYTTDKELYNLEQKGKTITNKSKHRLKLEEQYSKMGMSKEEAEAAANARIRTEKILAASAAVTVGACALYVANKERKRRIDGVIKAGEQMQRIEMRNTNGKLHDAFYVSKDSKDNRRYENLLGYARKQATGEAYLMKLEATKDVKVASQYNAAKVFRDLYNNDKDFRTVVDISVLDKKGGDNISPMKTKSSYEKFNRALVRLDHSPDSPSTVFYNKLKEAGYGAVQDINDMKYSGYSAKNPLIIFDNSNDNIFVKSVSEITNPSAKKATIETIKATGEAVANDYLEKAGLLSVATLTTTAATTYISDLSKDYESSRSR